MDIPGRQARPAEVLTVCPACLCNGEAMSYSILAKYITTEVASIDHGATVLQAAQEMQARHIGALLVENDGKPSGIITETDIVRRIVAESLDPANTRVHRFITQPILSLDINVMPHEVFLFMAEHKIRHVPMTHEGNIIGILSVRDLLHFFHDASHSG